MYRLTRLQGISLNIDQYKEFIKQIPAINAAIREQGFEVDDIGEKVQSSAKEVKSAKAKKANFDATSDEDEE